MAYLLYEYSRRSGDKVERCYRRAVTALRKASFENSKSHQDFEHKAATSAGL